MLAYGITRPQWVNKSFYLTVLKEKLAFSRFGFIVPEVCCKRSTVLMKIIGHVRHFRWLGPNVWVQISQTWIEYIKPIGQISDEPWRFSATLAGVYTKFSGRLSEEPYPWLIQKFPCILIFKAGQPGCQLNLSEGQIRLDLTSGWP